MFHLSNKLVQVIFNDKTQVLLNAENKEATYIDYLGKTLTQPISTALESGNKEMVDKIKHSNKMLGQIVTKEGRKDQDKNRLNTRNEYLGMTYSLKAC